MRVALGPVGAPSDVFPMFALGKALQSRGHHVILCAPEEYRARAYNLGFQMVSCGSSYERYLEGDVRLKDPCTELAEQVNADMAMHFVSLRDALREADVLVGSMLQMAGPSIAEQFGVVYCYAVTSPHLLDPQQEPHFGVPLKKINRSKLRKTWARLVLQALNRERQFSGLGPVHHLYGYLTQSGPQLIAVDPSMISNVNAEYQTVTGFWLYDQPESGTAELELKDSAKLVYFDYLYSNVDVLTFLETLCTAMLHAGLRPLFGSRWNALNQNELPEGCNVVRSNSYSTFLPQMSAVVHCGDSQMVAHAAKFGVPQIIVPRMQVQQDWANRLFNAGLAPAPITDTTAARLVDAIRKTIADSAIQSRCKEWSQQIESRDALEIAVDRIEQIAAEKKPALRLS